MFIKVNVDGHNANIIVFPQLSCYLHVGGHLCKNRFKTSNILVILKEYQLSGSTINNNNVVF